MATSKKKDDKLKVLWVTLEAWKKKKFAEDKLKVASFIIIDYDDPEQLRYFAIKVIDGKYTSNSEKSWNKKSESDMNSFREFMKDKVRLANE